MTTTTLTKYPQKTKTYAKPIRPGIIVAIAATIAAVAATLYYLRAGDITAYGDAESHLNIAKRVIDSLTPGLAQLGGIWLPLPHLLLVPFVHFDILWRTGLAGSIVSGTCFVVSAVFIYKLTHLVTKSVLAGMVSAAVFIANPNILYMQSTPMTELTLIVFFVLSTYYFVRFLHERSRVVYLISAAFFGLCASLSRYDGWALVLAEAGVIALMYLPDVIDWKKAMRGNKGALMPAQAIPIQDAEPVVNEKGWAALEGRLILFSTLAFIGIFLWLAWGWLILGDPLYFSHSEFSAKSQQNSWLARGELPAYHHISVALQYYAATVASNLGLILVATSLAGLFLFFADKKMRNKFFIAFILFVPFIFNVATLYLGQSVIFIPSLTPSSYEWNLFNVRYGVMMVPAAAFFIGYLFYILKGKSKTIVSYAGPGALMALIPLQAFMFASGASPVITLEDGRYGLSSIIAKPSEIQTWFDTHYDGGMVLSDDYSRSISIIRSPVPMQDVIYVGNKPYWDDSLIAPEKYATWIVIQAHDSLWQAIWENPTTQARLFKYFNKVYTSENFLIFKRINNATSTPTTS
jgi:hypothetical protein